MLKIGNVWVQAWVSANYSTEFIRGRRQRKDEQKELLDAMRKFKKKLAKL